MSIQGNETIPVEERLYRLLPAIHRTRDAGRGEALRTLMAVIEGELQAVEDDITGLYADWFIETCADWVVPYIGHMLGVRTLHDIQNVAGFSLRAYVANTLAYRRRKGTLGVLEQASRDVTGWPSSAVEFFQLLSTTQNMNHVRLRNQATLDLRDPNPLELLEGPFQTAAHTADVRHVNAENGWYNIPHVGLFLYRLPPYLIIAAPPKQEGPGIYHFSILGHDMPLFHIPEAEHEITRRAEETNVPTPIRRLALHLDLATYEAENLARAEEDRPANSLYYGPNRGINVYVNGEMVPPMNVVSRDLSGWERPAEGKVTIDPVTGRLAFAEGEDPGPEHVHVSYAYGYSADMGGGPYDRFQSMTPPSTVSWSVQVAKGSSVSTIQSALAQWEAAGRPDGIIEIADNEVYGGNMAIAVPSGVTLTIQAANGMRPDVRQVGNWIVSGPEDAALMLNGLLIQGALQLSGELSLTFRHCTLIPGMRLLANGLPQFPDRDSIVYTDAAANNVVTVDHSIIGPIRLPERTRRLVVTDSIIDACHVDGAIRPAIAGDDDALTPGPATNLERVTVYGTVYVRELEMASEVIFTDPVVTVRRQEGCVRFSYVPPGSETPRHFQCQPELALERYAEQLGKAVGALTDAELGLVVARLMPRFTSEHYGHHGYAQLSHLCADEVRTGAENGSEMGAFQSLMQPQREANLRAALDEYLPFGLEAGLIYVT